MNDDAPLTVRDLYVRDLEMRRGWRARYGVRPWDVESMEREHPIHRCGTNEDGAWVQITRCKRNGCCIPPTDGQLHRVLKIKDE